MYLFALLVWIVFDLCALHARAPPPVHDPSIPSIVICQLSIPLDMSAVSPFEIFDSDDEDFPIEIRRAYQKLKRAGVWNSSDSEVESPQTQRRSHYQVEEYSSSSDEESYYSDSSSDLPLVDSDDDDDRVVRFAEPSVQGMHLLATPYHNAQRFSHITIHPSQKSL